jgi:polar amino acid transport system substrate-binding protein
MDPITPAARSALAPGGKFRVGINHSNFLLVNPGSPIAAPTGIAADLALELGKRAGVPVEMVSFDAAGKLADAVRDAAVDAGFLASEAERANVIEFSPARPSARLRRSTVRACALRSRDAAPTTFTSPAR